MTAKHTQGPWNLVQEHIDPEWHIVTAPGGRIMANVHIEADNAMDEANARLISQAPKMAEALRDAAIAAYSYSATRAECQDLIERLRAKDWGDARKIAAANARTILAEIDGVA